MRIIKSLSLVTAVLVGSGTRPLPAQAVGATAAEPTEAQMGAMAAYARRLLHPAEWVLESKAELALTPDQVKQLEQLVLAQRDSAAARQARMSMTSVVVRAYGQAVTSWTGTVDEQAIRDGACEQSRSQAEAMIGMIRDRHAVGAVLTDAQRSQLATLQMRQMLKASAP